ncbi:stable inheritance protein KleA [Escherichia coli]|uniref:stable inheritance protein KleA n=1 Tax=Escherichia coli TaxID=562 RepID=UPI0026653EA1|nr:stable inheritance protein KleA [Escherichia coli]EDV1310818.1 protein kleA [Salmonella enterica subsp. enterica]EDW2337573.1 protein kleA [Salmonella enterica subsp. enterica]MDO2861507.1 stable inheritance protein KleA [Escherichia coli]
MTNRKIMSWVDALPNVAATDFTTRCDSIADKMAEAQELEQRAAKLREEAYFASLKLEGDAKRVWLIEAVEQAKHRANF